MESSPRHTGLPAALFVSSDYQRRIHKCAEALLCPTAPSDINAMWSIQDGPNILQDISFNVKAGERVGVGERRAATASLALCAEC